MKPVEPGRDPQGEQPVPKSLALFFPAREIEVAPFLEVIQCARIAVPQRLGDRPGKPVPGVFLLCEAFQVPLERPVAGRDPVSQEGFECPPRRDPMPRGVHEQIEVTLRARRFFTLLGKSRRALGKLRPLLIPARQEQKLRIIPEDDGVFGVGFYGFFVDFLGVVIFLASGGEEDGVDAEDVGVAGVGFDGLFVDFLGAVIFLVNGGEEGCVDAEKIGVGGICRRDFL